MSTHRHSTFFVTAQIAVLLTSLAAGAQETGQPATAPVRAALVTEAGQQIPAGAEGIAHIDTPRVATLLQLRGVMGSGVVTLRGEAGRDCLTLPVRLVAGDFGGNGIATHGAGPIALIIQSARVANALADGDDVVSDMYRISTREDDPDADIIIQSGLSESHGFVLNPGSSIVADLLGTSPDPTGCSVL